jgi:chaperonin GroES
MISRSERAMKVVPVGDKVVVKRAEAETASPGGILLPDTARERPRRGRVLSVGDGTCLPDGTRAKPQVMEGDHILFQSYSGAEVTIDGQELLILREEEILAIVP